LVLHYVECIIARPDPNVPHPQWFDTAASRADLRLVFLCLILGMTSWTGLCRLLRGETLKLREMEYIQAARAFGVSSLRILTRHILPNVMHIILISLVMDFSGLVLAEAVLSYVGVGVDPSTISFGTMINAEHKNLGSGLAFVHPHLVFLLAEVTRIERTLC